MLTFVGTPGSPAVHEQAKKIGAPLPLPTVGFVTDKSWAARDIFGKALKAYNKNWKVEKDRKHHLLGETVELDDKVRSRRPGDLTGTVSQLSKNCDMYSTTLSGLRIEVRERCRNRCLCLMLTLDINTTHQATNRMSRGCITKLRNMYTVVAKGLELVAIAKKDGRW